VRGGELVVAGDRGGDGLVVAGDRGGDSGGDADAGGDVDVKYVSGIPL
jgi:hypothetical protein